MREILVSRRGFMQGAGAVALAAVCSGMLTGCSGSTSEDNNEVTLGDFKVKVVSAKATGLETLGENGIHYAITPNIKLTYIGNGFTGTTFKNTFSATIAGVAMDIESNETILAADFPVIDISNTYSPVFITDDEDAFNAFKNGNDCVELTITLNQQKAVYIITYDLESKKYNISLK